MDFDDCFHEICHLWVMVNYLDYESGRAYVAYNNGYEGMLTVGGYTSSYNGYDDLEEDLAFIIAGVVGDKINNLFDEEDDVFKIFINDYSYGQDYKYFKKLYKTAVHYHSLDTSAEDWFDEKFIEIENYLLLEDQSEMEAAATQLLETGEYILEQNT